MQLSSGAALGLGLWAIFNKLFGGHVNNVGIPLLAVVLVMMMVGLLAAIGPARRSLKIEPTEALRQQ